MAGLVIPASGRLVKVGNLKLSQVFNVMVLVLPHQHKNGAEDGEDIRPEADTWSN